MRVVLGVSYSGTSYHGWQSQLSGNTVQDKLEHALNEFVGGKEQIRTICAGRTDSGVHALNQVVHFDTTIVRDEFSWVRATNRYLPHDIAVQWCRFFSDSSFHSRQSAISRRYVYVLTTSPVRPSLESHRVGWYWKNLDLDKMREAAQCLIGEHDFSAFRAAQCQALTPVKHMHAIQIKQQGTYWFFEFRANAFLHHMIRNIMGSLLAVGSLNKPSSWMKDVLESKQRQIAAATFSADGLYFLGPEYEARWGLPQAKENNMMLFSFDPKHTSLY